MTEWNPNDPYDLGIWDELGESSPASETEDLLPLKRTKTARKPIANKKMCGEAKIDGNKTNHSLRAYATSKLFQAGIPGSHWP